MATTATMLQQFLRLRQMEDELLGFGLSGAAAQVKAARTGLHPKILTALFAEEMDGVAARAQKLRRHVRGGGRVTAESFFDSELGTWTTEAVNAETRESLAKVEGCETAEASRRGMDELLEAAR